MEQKEFSKFLAAQRKKMLVDKYDEGRRIKEDPGEEYANNWAFTDEHGEKFRKAWIKSKCKTCGKVEECGFKVAEECDHYLPEGD